MSNKKTSLIKDVSPLTMSIIEGLVSDQRGADKPSKHVSMQVADPYNVMGAQEDKDAPPTLVKSIMNVLNGPKGSIERLAFETDPSQNNQYQGLFVRKLRLLPDEVLKRIAIQDDLVAAIVNARANHIGTFGRPRTDRHSIGFVLEPDEGILDKMSDEQKKEMQTRIDAASTILHNCGTNAGWADQDRMVLSQYLAMSTRNAIINGRIATEVIYAMDPNTGDKKFHSFRPIDAGTIFRAAPQREAAAVVREQARALLQQMKNKKLEPERFIKDEYAWVQVIHGNPVQAFTPEECLVHNFYPVADVELDGYPVTPLDTVIAAVTTHINITTHNKLYFQTGRATRGMLVIKSDDIDDGVVQRIKQQFNASINSVSNSWRMPVFGVGAMDEITWQPIDSGSRDMEFQYLSDNNARVILSAFQMSPEELPGYSHLCFDPDTTIWTDKGISSVGHLLNGDNEASGFKVWTGTKWTAARAFVTGERPVRRITTNNGVSITTSPEHRFRTISDSGELVWKTQSELQVGDHLLINKKPIEGTKENIPSYNGERLTVGMMEVLGWLTGDGSITVRKKGLHKHSKELEFFYHHEKEMAIRDRHFQIMSSFGLTPKIVDKIRSQEAADKIALRCGFKSVATVRKNLSLYNTEFVGWLLSLGFTPSNERKTIPAFIHGLPVEYRTSFLHGYFSADGSKDELDTPSITIMDPHTRAETKMLLAGLGIRTRVCEGTTALSISKVEGSEIYHRQYEKKSSRLIIKDKDLFFERIGFIQPHKQPSGFYKESERRWDKVSTHIAHRLADEIRSRKDLTAHQRDSVRHILKDAPYGSQCRDKVLRVAAEYGVALPEWINDFHQEEIVDIHKEDTLMKMVDIEVFDSEHAFTANGIVVHNSRGTNSQSLAESNTEYLLTAHRDVGIRPLLLQFQDFINQRILPLIDKSLAKFCKVKLFGLDAQTAEKESIRIQQDAAVHMTYDEILDKVEKQTIGQAVGGEFPLNPQWQAIADKYLFVGEILERFFGKKGAAADPRFQYIRDPFYFQFLQLQAQQQQMQVQQQAAQQQQASGGQQGGPQPQGGDGGQQQANEQSAQQDNQQAAEQSQQQAGQDLTRSIDQAISILGKGEKSLPPNKRKILAQQQATVDHFMSGWKEDSDKVIKEILDLAKKHSPKG